MSEPTMSEVVGRVTKYLDNVRAFVKRDEGISEMLDEPGYFATLDHADLRKLLAAYQSVREENARLKFAVDLVLDAAPKNALHRTGGTE